MAQPGPSTPQHLQDQSIVPLLSPALNQHEKLELFFQQAVATINSKYKVTHIAATRKGDEAKTRENTAPSKKSEPEDVPKSFTYPLDIASQLKNNRGELEKIRAFVVSYRSKYDQDPTVPDAEAQDEYMRSHELVYDLTELEYKLLIQFYQGVATVQKNIQTYTGQDLKKQERVQSTAPFPEEGFEMPTKEDFEFLGELELEIRRLCDVASAERCEKIQAIRDGIPNYAIDRKYISTKITDVQILTTSTIQSIRSKLRKATIDYYESQKDMPNGHAWCPVTQRPWLTRDFSNAHIVPHQLGDSALYLFGESTIDKDFINSKRNFLYVLREVEQAMDKGRITFYPVQSAEASTIPEFKLKVLDRSMLDEPVHLGDQGLTWRVAEGFAHLKFLNTSRPGKRNLYFHHIQSIMTAKRKAYEGWYDTYVDFGKLGFWPTPGKYLRYSMLHSLSSYVQMPHIPWYWIDGTFTESDNPRSPSMPKSEERKLARLHLIQTDAVIENATDGDEFEQQEAMRAREDEERAEALEERHGHFYEEEAPVDVLRSPPHTSLTSTAQPTSLTTNVQQTLPIRRTRPSTTGQTSKDNSLTGKFKGAIRKITPTAFRSPSPSEDKYARLQTQRKRKASSRLPSTGKITEVMHSAGDTIRRTLRPRRK